MDRSEAEVVWTDHDWRLVQAHQDVAQALSALTFFSDVPDRMNEIEGRRFRCFQDMAVICYCRPFTQSKGLPSLSFRKIGLKATREQRALHDELVAYRNKVVAHTDADRMRLAVKFHQIDDGFPLMPLIAHDKGFVYFNRWRELEALFRSVRSALRMTILKRGEALTAGSSFVRDYLLDEFPEDPFQFGKSGPSAETEIDDCP